MFFYLIKAGMEVYLSFKKNNLTFLLVDQYLSYKIYKLSVYLLLKRSGNLYLGKIFSIEACQMYD